MPKKSETAPLHSLLEGCAVLSRERREPAVPDDKRDDQPFLLLLGPPWSSPGSGIWIPFLGVPWCPGNHQFHKSSAATYDESTRDISWQVKSSYQFGRPNSCALIALLTCCYVPNYQVGLTVQVCLKERYAAKERIYGTVPWSGRISRRPSLAVAPPPGSFCRL